MESLLSQIKLLSTTADKAARRELMVALRDLAYSIEEPDDTIHRIGYLHLQTAAVRMGFDLGVFRYLTVTEGLLEIEQLVQKTGADSLFMSRYMSYLASIGAVREAAQHQYIATSVTKNLAEKVTEAGVSHCFETIGPQYQALPDFMKKTGYKNPDDEVHTVFQDAWHTHLHAFAWYKDQPEKLKYFNDYMAFRREPALSWLTVYPVEEELRAWDDPQKPVYVNIGGGIGHQCAQFKDKYPNVPGRVILQDLAHSIDKALPTPGVENMVHNFFEPQPVKGAKFYFSRGVLHNHPDHKVRLLLENTKSAMAPDSVMLLDEMVLPEQGVNAYAACMDLTMMAAFASMERTEAQWRALLESVGLKLVKTYTYNPVSYEGVMDVRIQDLHSEMR